MTEIHEFEREESDPLAELKLGPLLIEMAGKLDEVHKAWKRRGEVVFQVPLVGQITGTTGTDGANTTNSNLTTDRGLVYSVRRLSASGFTAGTVTAYNNGIEPVAAWTNNPLASTSNITGSVTSPGAGATIAQLQLPVGSYTVSWTVQLSGTLGAADTNNFVLAQTGTGAPGNVLTAINSPTANTFPQLPVTVTSTNANNFVKINTVGAGTVGAVYNAQMTITPIITTPTTVNPFYSYSQGQLLLQPGDRLTLGANGVVGTALVFGVADAFPIWYLPEYLD